VAPVADAPEVVVGVSAGREDEPIKVIADMWLVDPSEVLYAAICSCVEPDDADFDAHSDNAIDPDTAGKLQTLVAALQNKDYATAGNMSTLLANSVWRQHKDFLKGIKYLIQLAGKKL
jgi:hypothetical protein